MTNVFLYRRWQLAGRAKGDMERLSLCVTLVSLLVKLDRMCLLRAGPRDESCFESMQHDEAIIYAL